MSHPEKPRLAAMRVIAVVVVVLLVVCGAPVNARADGDPGSDVLVYQPSFVPPDADVSVGDQLRLTALLRAAARVKAPIRVAIIARRDDLGAVTALWRKPQAYARFLGIELSLGYKGQLLVVMPNGFGVNWPGHSTATALRSISGIAIRPGGAGMVAAGLHAAQALDRRLGVKITPAAPRPAPTAPGHKTRSIPTITIGSSPVAGGATSAAHAGGGSDVWVAVAGAIVALGRHRRWRARTATVLRSARAAITRRPRVNDGLRATQANRIIAISPEPDAPAGVAITTAPSSRRPRRAMLAVGGVAIAALAALVLVIHAGSPGSQADALETNPNLDPGAPLPARLAPNFTLYNQAGRRTSLRQFRGKVILLDFNDSECTTVCPLTTTAMLDAKRMLGPAARHVQLLGVDANPKATEINDVLSYTQLHGLTGKWQFLTGALPQLRKVWREYGIQADIQRGLISHTPALYVIDTHGRLQRLYITQQSYSAVGQLGQELAREASRLLPGHPPVHSHLSYRPVPTIPPTRHVTLPRAGGGRVALGPGKAHLYAFFDTWNRETTSLAGELDTLNTYAATASKGGLPELTAVDEGSVEPTRSALPDFLATLPKPLRYPVAIDTTGQIADGYQVQGEPWLVLTAPSGKILWYDGIETSPWPTLAQLHTEVRAALSPNPRNADTIQPQLIGSPVPLAKLHRQASSLIGAEPQLLARIKALQGYPIVVNVWASWCQPCQEESPLFASASVQFGRQVAFLGADADASPDNGRSFLSQHHVSYPSYSVTQTGLSKLLKGGLEGLPTTIYIDRDGQVAYVHDGLYSSQGVLNSDIDRIALDSR